MGWGECGGGSLPCAAAAGWPREGRGLLQGREGETEEAHSAAQRRTTPHSAREAVNTGSHSSRRQRPPCRRVHGLRVRTGREKERGGNEVGTGLDVEEGFRARPPVELYRRLDPLLLEVSMGPQCNGGGQGGWAIAGPWQQGLGARGPEGLFPAPRAAPPRPRDPRHPPRCSLAPSPAEPAGTSPHAGHSPDACALPSNR